MSVDAEAMAWSRAVFGGCELGDKRRTQRLVTMGATLASHVGASPHAACRGNAAQNEGAYRLLRNEAVEPEAIAKGGFRAAIDASAQCAEVLAVEDTTTLSYGHAAREALGDIGGPVNGRKRGFQVHSVLLLDAHSGRTLGLGAQQRWCRETHARGQRHRRHERRYEDKESFKWQRASDALRERIGKSDMRRVISVCDREADIFDYLHYKVSQSERFIVRGQWDRRTTGEARRLFAEVAAAPVLGTRRVAIAQRGGRAARTVEVALRGCVVEVREPKRRDSGKRVEVNALLATELGVVPPQTGLRWLLLTSEAVDEQASAQRLMDYYERRWRIEEFHKAWKSGGAQVEARRMQTAGNLERIAVILGFVAVRLLQLREGIAEESTPAMAAQPRRCDEVLEPLEWKVLWLSCERDKPLPEQPPTLSWAYERVAQLGGWLDSKRTGRAGWKALWEGWFRLGERVDAVRLTQNISNFNEM